AALAGRVVAFGHELLQIARTAELLPQGFVAAAEGVHDVVGRQQAIGGDVLEGDLVRRLPGRALVGAPHAKVELILQRRGREPTGLGRLSLRLVGPLETRRARVPGNVDVRIARPAARVQTEPGPKAAQLILVEGEVAAG